MDKRILVIGGSGVAVIVVIGVIAFSVMGGASTSVLDVENPTDEQIAQIAELLLVEDEQIRRRADQKLFDLGARAVPVLTQFAREGHAQADMALSLLSDIDPNAVFPVVEELLENPTNAVRARAVTFLSAYEQDARAVELWVKALEDAEADIRAEAANFLRDTPPAHRSAAVRGLEGLRGDPDRNVREKAAESIRALTGRDVSAQFNVN